MNNDVANILLEQVVEASRTNTPLEIIGNGSKHFYGNAIQATPLVTSQHSGIINYEPTELVITARSGTPLDEIESELNKNNQQLAFEPPHFRIFDTNRNRVATLGGCIATGLSGPARANNGSARDFVLGCEIINGKGEQLKFGGQVMKNVAGYDVSRLMCGSMGTLGVILNVSLKVLPKPEKEISISFKFSSDEAYANLAKWNSLPYPITASCYYDGLLTIRLAGNAQAVEASQKKLGGDKVEHNEDFWISIKEHFHPHFRTNQPLWRISTKPNTNLNIDTDNDQTCLTEWHGALHWLTTKTPAKILRHNIEQIGGHATLFRNAPIESDIEIFHPLPEPLMNIHNKIKRSFDPENILNPNKMYRFK